MNDILVVVYLLIYVIAFLFNCLSFDRKVKVNKTNKVKFAIKFAKLILFILFAAQIIMIIAVHSYFGGYWFLIPVVLFNRATAK